MSAPAARLSVREKFAYGLGDTASNFFFQAFNLFLFYYYTDVFGLSAAAVGTMMLFTRILDAVTDPLMGIIADRTNTRWGKFRPWILWGAIPYGLLGYLMFANPSLSGNGKLIYAYVTYSLMWLAYTVVNIPYSALMGVMSPSSEDRTSLSTYRFVCAFAGAFLISALTLPLKDFLGGDDPAAGFRYTMALFAVVSVGLFFYTFATTRERVTPPRDQSGSLRADLGALFRNRPWVVLFIAAFLTLANVGIRNGTIIYYFKYNVGDEAKFTLFSTLGSLAFIAGALSTKFFVARFSRRSLMIGLTSLNALAMASFYFIDPQNIVLLHAVNIVGTFLVGPTPAIVWSLYADTADYGEWKNGRRATGLVFSAAVFAQKMGLAIGSALIGWLLAWYGFVANAAQTPATLGGILILFSLLPAALSLLSAVAIAFYPLDEPVVKQMERELGIRRAQAA